MRRGILFTLLFVLIINILFVSGAYNLGNKSYDLSNTYGPGANIQGWLNVSITNANIDLNVRDSLNNKINLINFLRNDNLLVEDVDYSCSPTGCGSSYTATNGESEKSFVLNAGQEKIIGFKFDGILNNIDDSNFKITSNVAADCSNQLEIDFFADDDIETGNTQISLVPCSGLINYGCFDSAEPNELSPMTGGGNMYCQRIRLSESPGFKLGAWLEIQAGAEKTTMGIYDLDLSEELINCELDNAPLAGGEVSCDVDFLITKSQDYYVCIYNNHGTDSKTKIKNYVDPSGCGFFSAGFLSTEDSAYQIFAEGKKFGPVGTLEITDDSHIDGLSSDMLYYINDVYGGYECPIEGCIVPIKFISNKDQTITINDILISYTSSRGPREIANVYDLGLSSAKVSTEGYKKISLSSSGFTAPTQVGYVPYSVFFDADELFVEDIIIEPVPEILSIFPSTAFTQFPINLFVSVKELANASIDEYFWQFGEATPIKTTTNKLENHIFVQSGQTPLKITVTDIKGKTNSKTFILDVGSYQALFPQKLKEAQDNIANVSAKIKALPKFYQDGIAQVFDADEITRKLSAIEDAYDDASTDNEYTKVVNDFLSLDVPVSIDERVNTDYVSYYLNKENVNVDAIKEFLGGDFESSKESEYVNAVLDWSVLNSNSKIKYKRLDVKFQDRSEQLLNVFELNVKQTGDTGAPGSIFIRQLEDMQFDKSYGEEVRSGYVHIPINGEKTIIFLTTEEVDVINVPIFISPTIASLPLVAFEEQDVQGIRWALFIVIVVFLIIVGLVAYVFLQHWYKTKYETYLFKNRNYLFNLIHYIDVQKKKGTKDGEIFRKLKKQGWNSEQINYVIKKYLGKRTGMLELPVEKVLKWFKKQPTPTPGIPRPGMRPPLRRPMRPRKRFPVK